MTTFLLLIAAPPFRRVAFGIWPVMIMRRQFYGSWHRRHEQERVSVWRWKMENNVVLFVGVVP
jgi:cyanate permease